MAADMNETIKGSVTSLLANGTPKTCPFIWVLAPGGDPKAIYLDSDIPLPAVFKIARGFRKILDVGYLCIYYDEHICKYRLCEPLLIGADNQRFRLMADDAEGYEEEEVRRFAREHARLDVTAEAIGGTTSAASTQPGVGTLTATSSQNVLTTQTAVKIQPIPGTRDLPEGYQGVKPPDSMEDLIAFINDKPPYDEKPRIKRPRNAWVIYRTEKSHEIHVKNSRMTAGQISKIAAAMWKAETPEVRQDYEVRAAEEALQHKIKHPSYKFKPGKKCLKKQAERQLHIAKPYHDPNLPALVKKTLRRPILYSGPRRPEDN